MRTLSVMLVAVAMLAAGSLYDMLAVQGEGSRTVPGAASAQAADAKAARGDWASVLQRHDPPLDPPATVFAGPDGAMASLADFAGQGVVLNLWATWCGPCVREMPALDRLQRMVAADGILVVAVSSDREGMNAVKPFLGKHQLTALKPYLDQKGAFTRSFPGRGLPQTYIINRAGKIVASYTGPAEWDDASLVTAVRELTR